jgi:hypothetical protein
LSPLEQRIATVADTNLPPPPALEGNEAPIAHGEMKQGLLVRHVVLIAAMVLSMTGWVYALGWVALQLV